MPEATAGPLGTATALLNPWFTTASELSVVSLGYDTSCATVSCFFVGGLAANDMDAICFGCLDFWLFGLLVFLLLEDKCGALLLETACVRKTVDKLLFCLAFLPFWDRLSKIVF